MYIKKRKIFFVKVILCLFAEVPETMRFDKIKQIWPLPTEKFQEKRGFAKIFIFMLNLDGYIVVHFVYF